MTTREQHLANRRAQGARHRAKNPENARRSVREYYWRKKGIVPTRPAPGACECCGRKQKAHLCADHDHKTGEFRGWLCHQCNVGIGKLGDSLDGVLNALTYFKRMVH